MHGYTDMIDQSKFENLYDMVGGVYTTTASSSAPRWNG